MFVYNNNVFVTGVPASMKHLGVDISPQSSGLSSISKIIEHIVAKQMNTQSYC